MSCILFNFSYVKKIYINVLGGINNMWHHNYIQQLKLLGVLKKDSNCYKCIYSDRLDICKKCSRNYKDLFKNEEDIENET
jgi:hypothetical protein